MLYLYIHTNLIKKKYNIKKNYNFTRLCGFNCPTHSLATKTKIIADIATSSSWSVQSCVIVLPVIIYRSPCSSVEDFWILRSRLSWSRNRSFCPKKFRSNTRVSLISCVVSNCTPTSFVACVVQNPIFVDIPTTFSLNVNSRFPQFARNTDAMNPAIVQSWLPSIVTCHAALANTGHGNCRSGWISSSSSSRLISSTVATTWIMLSALKTFHFFVNGQTNRVGTLYSYRGGVGRSNKPPITRNNWFGW